MSKRSTIPALVFLAVLSVVLDIIGGMLAPSLRLDFTLLLFVARVALDVAIVACFFLRRRAVWIGLTTLYAMGILWRLLVLGPGLFGVTRLPSPAWAAWLFAGHLGIAFVSLILLSLGPTRRCFGYGSSA